MRSGICACCLEDRDGLDEFNVCSECREEEFLEALEE